MRGHVRRRGARLLPSRPRGYLPHGERLRALLIRYRSTSSKLPNGRRARRASLCDQPTPAMFPKVEGRLFSLCLATAKIKSIVSDDMPRSWGCGAAGQSPSMMSLSGTHTPLRRAALTLNTLSLSLSPRSYDARAQAEVSSGYSRWICSCRLWDAGTRAKNQA